MCDISRLGIPLKNAYVSLEGKDISIIHSVETNLIIPIPAIKLAQLFELGNLCPAKGQSSRNGESKSSSKAMRSLAENWQQH